MSNVVSGFSEQWLSQLVGRYSNTTESGAAAHIVPCCCQLSLTLMFLLQVGLFRKSGVKSRIQALRQMNENSPDNVNYEDQSAYDVADMVKQFFRDLPEPLLTSKLGETFLHIYQCKDTKLCLFVFCHMSGIKG